MNQHKITEEVSVKDLIAQKPELARTPAERAYFAAWSLGAHLGFAHPLQLRAVLRGFTDGFSAASGRLDEATAGVMDAD